MFRPDRTRFPSPFHALFLAALLIFILSGLASAQEEEGHVESTLELASGSRIPFTVAATGSLRLAFTHPGNRFIGLRISVPASATLHFAVICTDSAGEYSIDWHLMGEIEGTAGSSTLVDVLPQFGGHRSVVLRNETIAPVQGMVEIVDMGAIPNVPISDKPGRLIVRKGARSKLQIFPDMPDDSGTSVFFEGFSPHEPALDVTPGGDAAYTVPPGLWKVSGITDDSEVPFATHFVPVLSGKTTIIENWPILDSAEATETAGISGLKLRSVATAGADIRVRFSTPGWQGAIVPGDLSVQEGGMPGEVIDVRPLASPMRLALLLDSSGSMKNDMKNVLTAAETFLKGLPQGTIVDLIDFDTKPKPLSAAAPEALLKLLRGIKADGATALNDTVILGLKRTAGYDRPAVVLLTDGFDANHNDTGPGSKAAPAEMFKAAQQAGVPIFTIGYGKKPDDATLRRLAELSGGSFHRAQADSVAKVFAQLNSILGREFEMLYRRPGITAPSDAPVVCIVQDVSGSMNMPPEESGETGYRMEQAKEILRSFTNRLPDNSISQIISFTEYMNILQAWTGNREALLRGISEMFAGGGTDITGALNVAYRSLKLLPSNRRYLLFVTDAAMPSVADDEEFQAILGKIRDAGIDCTFVGMVGSDKRACFDEAARFTGGFAAVSEDPTAMREATDRLGTRIAKAKAGDGRREVRLVLAKKDEGGRMRIMGHANLFNLPPSPQTAIAAVHGIRYVIQDDLASSTGVKQQSAGAIAAAPATGAPGSDPSSGAGKDASRANTVSPREEGAAFPDSVENSAESAVLPGPAAFHTPLTQPGISRWKALLDLDETAFLAALRSLTCIPARVGGAGVVYSPEAVLTQGWGTPADLCAMTAAWASAHKIPATLGILSLTDTDRAELVKTSGFGAATDVLPAIKLNGKLIRFPHANTPSSEADSMFEETSALAETPVRLTVRAFVEQNDGNQAAQLGNIGDALGGGSSSGPQPVVLLETELPASKLSRDAIDLAFARFGDGRLKAVVWLPDGTMLSGTSDQTPDIKELRLTGCEIDVQPGEDDSVKPLRISLNDGESLENTVFSLAIFAPDLPQETAPGLESAWKDASSKAPATSWNRTREFLHGRIAKFIALQTRHERELATSAGIRIGRPDEGRIIILRVSKTAQGLSSSIDLRRVAAQAAGEQKAAAAFQFGAGIFNAALEEKVGGGSGLVSWWGNKAVINVIPPGKADVFADFLQEKGLPEAMVGHIREAKGALLFPQTPRMEGDTPRWSWFEIAPETFAMTSILDDGSHGMAESVILEHAQNANSWCVGFLIGVDVALGSTAAFSLTGEEYKDVLAMAEEFAMGLKEQLTKIGPNPGFSYGGATVSLDGFSFDPTDPNGSHEAFGNFGDGFEKGVAFYFMLARPKDGAAR